MAIFKVIPINKIVHISPIICVTFVKYSHTCILFVNTKYHMHVVKACIYRRLWSRHIRTRTHTHSLTRAPARTYTLAHTRTCALHIHSNARTRTHTHMRLCALSLQVCVYEYVYVCIYMYAYVSGRICIRMHYANVFGRASLIYFSIFI